MCKTCGCHGAQVEKKVFTVEGMSCGHCKSAVENAARALTGVMAAEVNLDAKTLTVEYDPAKSTVADISAAIEDIGFSVV